MFGLNLALASPLGAQGADEGKPEGALSDAEKARAAEQFMTLGIPGGQLGGERKKEFELDEIKTQILTFIPPLLRPAFTGHAFVLPPKAFSVSMSRSFWDFDGSDFFMGGSPNPAFKDRTVERHFSDLDLFYGFDLNHKYLHSFTFRVNIPYVDTEIGGHLHPAAAMGMTEIPRIDAIASSQEIGDIGIFLKKKLLDQGNDAPFGLAVVGAVFLPTGSNDEKFGSDGKVVMAMPSPGGVMEVVAPFMRFSDDGRIPTVAQPGTGSTSYLLGAFLTKQFSHGAFPGRSALHLGATHKFISGDDGIDPGDETTYFASFVKPIYKDYLAVDVSIVGKHLEDDSYAGLWMNPVMGMMVPRPSFSGGDFQFAGASLIFSPDPQIRFTASGLYRFTDPDLGPAPPWIGRMALDVIF